MDTVKGGLLLITDISLGPFDLFTNNLWFIPEIADSTLHIADIMKHMNSLIVF